MKKNYLTILIIIITILTINTSAETITRDVEIKIILENPEPNQNHTKIFKVENLDHETGTTDLLHFFINATIEWNTTRTINKYTETGLGTINLEPGKYELCVELTPLNFEDTNLSNNKDCKNITTTELKPINETTEENNEETPIINETKNMCDCKLEIITEKNIYENGETISFIIKDCSNTTKYEEEIEYWVENIFGEITKNKLETTTKTPKSYTPRIQESEKTFLIKTKINNCTQIHKKIITIRNQEEQEPKNTNIEITTQKEAKPGDIIILELKGYKAKTLKTLINIQLELQGKKQSETLKVYVQKQNTDFHLRIPFQIPTKLPEGLKEYEITAEGLDTQNTTMIIINKEEKEPETKINNLYTRKQKFEEDINIIISWEGPENTKLRITTQKETKLIELTTKTETIPIRIKKHNETIIAELITNEETKDIQILQLNLENNEEEQEQPKIGIKEESEEQKIIMNNQELITILEQQEQQKAEIKEESEEQKTITAKTTMTQNQIKENQKQIIFIIITTISLLILFKQEIKKSIQKITKTKS